ncbi:hypothetical protein GALL_376790 [mine drainage metagenome]|uniref:Uncharacterized protein n=1 Tax=mine drainage metagenome TaxID=410659 RepID=A0A1J5QKV7_9ZZZZ
MLGNVALRGADELDNVLHADFLITQHAQDLESQRVRHGLEGQRRLLDVLVALNEFELAGFLHLF